ncbi:MAG: imidazole glycerol phosphate synthase subunit HisF [Kiritimatiellae bacterium]|nr:imidazole glycerol phosphate synthase subunit HisF [Kiritimatiellia bacterium]
MTETRESIGESVARAPISIMPCLDIRDARVVKGVHFVDIRDAGDPVECARNYEQAGADELGFLDITATVEGRRTIFDVLRRVTEAVRIPVTLGGGIKSLADVESAFAAGAAKVSISSAAFRDPGFVAEAVRQFGGERIVIAIDADRNEALPSKREVYIDGGRTPTGADAVEFALKMAGLGAGTMLPTSKLGDGTKAGYDLELTRGIADATHLPTIASGGAGTLEHFLAGVKEGHASTLLAASVFHFGILGVGAVKAYLREHGVAVR